MNQTSYTRNYATIRAFEAKPREIVAVVLEQAGYGVHDRN